MRRIRLLILIGILAGIALFLILAPVVPATAVSVCPGNRGSISPCPMHLFPKNIQAYSSVTYAISSFGLVYAPTCPSSSFSDNPEFVAFGSANFWPC